ncbi:hypothetical protein BCL57_001548 [Agromyces flavus]|uniref:Uncharacterized protein n=1 Tax=Agromyces flavus TaxID=589382 RepID=A0A1H2A2H9_9MICO|nr:hypothetical protein [Agromyces flavus]MCP2367394.1 hypothetical protein [Agromyces flavus]GGI45812.1 hypothetical protein GCM10010932_11460 [Agromyces flavus]SDT40089.1 hypothetical protein SAMN04489721_3472 [Agromyces flavus]
MVQTIETVNRHPSRAPLEMARLRYPAEPSRLAMAVVSVASALVVFVAWLAVSDLSLLFAGGIALVVGGFFIWVAWQFGRVHLLGDAILVSAETFPEVQNAVDEVRAALQYDRRVDIFVIPNLSPRIQLKSYFGIRALLIEGGAIADMTTPASRSQLLFLLGTYFGAFKAKHDRSAVVELTLDSAGIRRLLAPFVAPWLRTTVYTGDQIAYACSGDFGASISAVHRVLVGRELSPQLAAAGLILQADRVSKSWVLRVAEMLRPEPHATNRFLNLVRFAQQVDPESVLAFRATLSPEINGKLDEALERMSRAGRRNAGVALVTVGVIVLSAMLLFVPLRAVVGGSQADGDPVPIETAVPETPAVPEDPEPVAPEPTAAQVLAATVPATVGETCTDLTPPAPELSDGLLAAIECDGPADPGVDVIQLYAYDSHNSVLSAGATATVGLSESSCVDQGWNLWTDGNGDIGGVLGCYYSEDGATVAAWTNYASDVLVVAWDENVEMSVDDIYVWWQYAAPALALN